MAQRKLLEEVCLIRLMLIILLVLYHAFAPFSGAWTALENQESVEQCYRWVAIFSYSFMLEAFTFISGYIFGFQVQNKGQHVASFKTVLYGKLKRLIIPSFIFSIIYLLLLQPGAFDTPTNVIIGVLSGVGHMWYLPMLFWCFIATTFIEKYSGTPRNTIFMLAGLSLISFIPFPFRINSAMYYMFFFFVGYAIKRFGYDVKDVATRKYIFISAITYLFVLISSISVKELYINEINGGGYSAKAIKHILTYALRLMYSTFGIIMIYLASYYLIYKKNVKLNSRLINLSSYCFGIYICQQFILQAMYYHTDLQDYINIQALPWIGFIATLLISYIFTKLLFKTRIGRFLIG